MSTTSSVPEEVQVAVQAALKSIDDLIRQQSDDAIEELMDYMIHATLQNYLPFSRYDEGLYAYTYDEAHWTDDSRVYIAAVQDVSEVAELLGAEVVA